MSCTIAGKASLKPALVNGGTATSETFTFKGKLSACTGTQGGGVMIVGGSLTATGMATSNSCANLAMAGSIPVITATVKWKGAPHTPKVAPSTIVFTGGDVTIGTAITIDLPGGSHTSSVTGSFAGNTGSMAHAVTDTTTAQFATDCGGKGVKGFKFTGVNGTSTLKVQ